MKPSIWKYTLCPHVPENFTFDSFIQVAKDLGYPFLLWDRRLYSSTTGKLIPITLDKEI